jgi:DNA-binding beta-propeller fold protein YncE
MGLMARGLILLCALLGALAGVASPAQANRALLTEEAVSPSTGNPVFPPPDGQIEGACGVALLGGSIYVSDYYHHAVDNFSSGPVIPVGAPNGPCGLASAGSGALYANIWHQSVVRLLPSALTIDEGESTGVAVDQATGNLYVDDGTYVAVYEPSGAAVLDEGGKPLRIGLGPLGESSLGDGYGVAVLEGKVYVPDAADNTVKVYEPATDPVNPSSVIGATAPGGGFNSLVDAAVTVDPTTGHLLVLDNLQPGFEHPEAAIDEFDASGNFLGQLAQRVIDGEPSGLAVSGGDLYVTTGNDEGANVVEFGPYTASAPLAAEPPATVDSQQVASASESSAVADPLGSGAAAKQALRLLSSGSGAKGSSATIAAVLPSPGTLSVTGTGLRTLRTLPTAAGRRTLHLRLNGAGKRALARAKLRKLEVKVLVTFTPSHGAALFASKTVDFQGY